MALNLLPLGGMAEGVDGQESGEVIAETVTEPISEPKAGEEPAEEPPIDTSHAEQKEAPAGEGPAPEKAADGQESGEVIVETVTEPISEPKPGEEPAQEPPAPSDTSLGEQKEEGEKGEESAEGNENSGEGLPEETENPVAEVTEELPETEGEQTEAGEEEQPETEEEETGLVQDESGVYQINGSEDWALFCEMLANGHSFAGETVSLNKSITITNPAGAFSGTLLGNGKTITLKIGGNDSNVGVFTRLNGATIRRLNVKGSVKGNDNVGGIAGTAANATFESCTSDVKVLAKGDNAGGIAGRASGRTVFNKCQNKDAVSGKNNVGGIVGYAEATITLTSCTNRGWITGRGSKGNLVGKKNGEPEEEPAEEAPATEEAEQPEPGAPEGVAEEAPAGEDAAEGNETGIDQDEPLKDVGSISENEAPDKTPDEESPIDPSSLLEEPENTEAGEGLSQDEEGPDRIPVGNLPGEELPAVDGSETNEEVKYIDGNTENITGTYTIKGNVKNDHRLNVQESATIILPEGMTMELPAGIHVRQGSTLTIKGKGKLIIAQAPRDCAGIGSDSREDAGTIIIDGSTVTAQGGYGGAGIGGGNNSGGGGNNRNGGNVTITGGTVTAQGGNGGAGIGGGWYENGGTIKISGGTVTAYGGKWSAGIGGGNRSGNGGTIKISGGTVTATGGKEGAGIGGGNRSGNGGTIEISGGTVKAIGGEFSAGIGGGNNSKGGNVTITGGTVVAESDRAPAIGSGANKTVSDMGTLTLDTAMGAFDTADNEKHILIEDPTPENLVGLRKILVRKVPVNNAREPLAVTSRTYTGIQQNAYDDPGCYVVLAGTTSAAELGEYTFTATPMKGHAWEDGTTGTKTYHWSIVWRKATVKANDVVMTYGEKEPELTATVSGTDSGDRLNYQLTREFGRNAGTYRITPEGEKHQGLYEVTYEQGTLTINPKDVSAHHWPSWQIIADRIGEFTGAGSFYDKQTGENIPGTLVYSYNGREMTKEAIEAELATLPVGTVGTIYWTYTASGNFTGVIQSSIGFVVRGINFTVRDQPADETNAVIIKENPTYGDTWNEIVRFRNIIAAVKRVKGSGRYFLNVEGTPNAGEQEYTVMFTGHVGPIPYNNVTVLSGKVNIAKADYANVTKTASAEVAYKEGSSVMITLPQIPQGADYGVPQKAEDSDPYMVSKGSNGKAILIMTNTPEGAEPMTFTVPIIPDGNHIGYDITVTVSKAEPKTATEPTAAAGLIYNGKVQNGAATMGEHVTLAGALTAVNAGEYSFIAVPEAGYTWEDGSAEAKTYAWTITPKDVSATRAPVAQNVSEGLGEFTAPGGFRDGQTDEDIPGTLTYTYNDRQMTQEAIEAVLAKLPVGRLGVINWTYTADGNFTGTIRGSIIFVIRGIEFTVNGQHADESNAVTIKEPPTYGDTWAEIVKIKDITASVLGVRGSGEYFLNVEGTPNAGEQNYSVMFTGRVGLIPYNNVTVFSGKVNIAKADYADVTKTASGEMNAEAGSTVTITLPAIPQGASYGTPVKGKESDAYTLSAISGNQITVTSDGIAQGTENVIFTVPVNPDENHHGYTVTVTVSVIHTIPKKITVTVTTSSRSLPLLPLIRVYTAKINVEATGTEIAKVEHSELGRIYIRGNEVTSLSPNNGFFIRVTEVDDTIHVYEYRNGKVTER